jgi:hypothetical protein
MDASQSSQLTNDRSEPEQINPSTNNDKTTPVRISYRMNPDGSRVSISRPPLTPSHPSPLRTINRVRHISMDVYSYMFLLFV